MAMSVPFSDCPKPTDTQQYLQQLGEEGTIYFRPNAGNAGDSLIATATYQLFERLGLDFKLIPDAGFDPVGKVVVCGGGGAFLSCESSLVQRIAQWHSKAKRLVVLPHTYTGHESLLAQLGDNVDLFARERVSYDHLSNHAQHANIRIGHDMAFSLDLAEVMKSEVGLCVETFAPKRMFRRYLWLALEGVRRSKQGANVLHCLRTDSERSGIRVPRRNADISKLFKCGGQAPELAARSTRMVLNHLSCYDVIVTNRLHLAIAGGLLGKLVRFHANSYHKCASVFEYSIKGLFPSVEWMGDSEVML